MKAELLYDPPASALPPARVQDAPAIWHRPAFWPVLVLLASLIVTAVFWRNARLDVNRELQENLERQATELTQSIEAHLAAQAQVLRGFKGLFNASSQVNRREFPPVLPVSPFISG